MKTCPFCGDEAEVSVWPTLYVGHYTYAGMVTCRNCGAEVTVTDASTKEQARNDVIRLWNTRAERTCRRVGTDNDGSPNEVCALVLRRTDGDYQRRCSRRERAASPRPKVDGGGERGMTVKELIEELQEAPDDATVLFERDGIPVGSVLWAMKPDGDKLRIVGVMLA